MSKKLFLGLLETAGNQAYIFATNRLRENVGASQRVWEAGVTLTYQSAEEVTGCSAFKKLHESAMKGPDTHAQAMNSACAPRVSKGADIEIVVATSGKTLFLAGDESKAEELVAHATRKVAERSPGLILRGAVVSIEGESAKCASNAVGAVHRQIDAIRDELPVPEARFPTLPFLEPCASSGLPAKMLPNPEIYGPHPQPASDVTLAKCSARRRAQERISRLVNPNNMDSVRTTENLEKMGTDWIGIVHADGNGLGQLFLKFDELCGERTCMGYFDALRKFSLSLDLCGVAAFRTALETIHPDACRTGGTGSKAPLVPLVLGGDDLTVLCDGRVALSFTAAYLQEFQKQSQKGEVLGQKSLIPNVLRNTEWSKLGAAAGIAITKPHYPFHRGYELAESLLKEAKTAKKRLGVSRCAFDFHVLFDGAETTLQDLRDRWTLPSGHRLTARPYVLGEDKDRTNAWAVHRNWNDLQDAAKKLAGEGHKGEGESGLPRSQQYELRAALFRGVTAADRRLALIQHRYADFHWTSLTPCADAEPPSLFFPIDEKRRACRLLDALELADLGSGDAK